MNESKLPPPRAESEGQPACVKCGHSGSLYDGEICIKSTSHMQNCGCKCVFPEPSKGEQGQPPSTVQVTFCGKCGQTGLHNTRCSKCGNRLMFSDEITYARVRSGVTQQSVGSVYDKAIRAIVEAKEKVKLTGKQGNSQRNNNRRALEERFIRGMDEAMGAVMDAKAKSLAAQNKDQEKS